MHDARIDRGSAVCEVDMLTTELPRSLGQWGLISINLGQPYRILEYECFPICGCQDLCDGIWKAND